MSHAYPLSQFAKEIGIPVGRIQSIIDEHNVTLVDHMLPDGFVSQMFEEVHTYIGLTEYAASHASSTFRGNKKDANKLLEKLEMNDFYGVTVHAPSDLLSGDERCILYLKRDDIPFLDEKLAEFFHLFAMSEQDKIEALLSKAHDKDNSVMYVRKYLDAVFYEQAPTGIITDFVKSVLLLPDIASVTDDDILKILKTQMAVGTKKHLIRFLNFVRQAIPVHYSSLTQRGKESVTIGAYSDDVYLSLAKCIFNAEYIAEHCMIERALDNHLFIEMWLYLSVFYTCGWRAKDICTNWQYLHLDEKPDNPYGINPDTLYDDILYDRLPDTVYEDVCKYAITSLQLSGATPSKTQQYNPTALAAFVAPELAPFYGLLTLIAEAVHLRTGEGFMNPKRTSVYQKKTLLREFFGTEMYQILHGENIQSRRLNKDFLQGIEESARRNGCGGVMASAVASYARNHTNIDTIAHYLRDHNFSGENAEMVIFYMLQRGVFGFEAYQVLLTAYPDAFRQLPMKDQTALMSTLKASPFQIEMEQSGNAAISFVRESFMSGNDHEVSVLLRDMFEISQGRGQSKHEGVYCTLRARNESCPHPEYSSCIAYGCPYLVFTRYGLVPLLEVLRDFKNMAESGDAKAASVLRQVLLPRYKNILNAVMRDADMSQADRQGIKLLMEDILHGE